MPKDSERAVASLLLTITRAHVLGMPEWLVRPGKSECQQRWPLLRAIYHSLTNMQLPETMRRIERRDVDLIFQIRGQPPRVFEYDEKQHFNGFRLQTLKLYASAIPLAFDPEVWMKQCAMKKNLEGGGFAKPMPPLFPGLNGRHRQRAFRDALSDILPLEHNYLPTLRIAHFEVEAWLGSKQGGQRIRDLLRERDILN